MKVKNNAENGRTITEHRGIITVRVRMVTSDNECWLLVAEIPMFALKFKHFDWHGNALRYSFALASVALLCALGLAGFSAVIVLYIVCSLVNNAVAKAGKQ